MQRERLAIASNLQCPLCQRPSGQPFHFGIRGDPEWPVYRCANCGLRFIPPKIADPQAYYRDGAYGLQHSSVIGKVLSPKEKFDFMSPLIALQVELFKRVVPKGAKVLEIGCASGYFLNAIRQDYTVWGNEWNTDEADFVSSELGIPCSTEPLEEAFQGEKFTAICAFQVLEHIADPLAWLKLVKSRLIGGGWIYLEVPNVDDALVSIYDLPEFKQFYYRDCHLTYWDMETLGNTLGAVGFEARVVGRQRYSLFNHLHWLMRREPQADLRVASYPFGLPREHPAAPFLNEFYARADRDYRQRLDKLKACDTLIGVGVKREI